MHSTPTRSRRSRGGSVSSSSDPTQDMDRFSLISGLDRISVLSQLSSLERSNVSSTSAASTLDRSASRSSRTSGSLDRMLSGEERFSSLSCHPTPTLRHREMKSNPKSEPSSPGHSYHYEESAGGKDERTAGCCSMSADEPSYANLNQTKPPAVPSCVKSFMSWMVNKAGKGTTALLDTLPNLSKEDFHIVMIGLDGAGKSTALYRMKFNQYINTVPTIGFNCERIRGTLGKTRGLTFLIWDVGGQEKIRPLWRSYTRCTDGIVFVVDSANSDSFEEAKMELFRTMRYQDNSSVPLLVLANKQDLTSAVSAHQIEEVLGLRDLNSSLWQVEPTCSITGEGLDTGLEALHQLILKKKKLLKRNRNKTK
ncbi:ADP-ribosylation factor-like protein 4A [Eurytemora carolleeae]|uniref:ADP-ribosylation factor-like protein 4A n=1 Tax=Eurytemora carolleeae TaxID=1294199 RepID=UPI000C77CCC9|nr:ADP-ribosylation factor-like protein 4A [Eurytemora carolleeae]|eukprot:XP_023337265.1 ADP-ribosylation factor-like protein 4A [Eurytemora affinis]